MKKQTIKEYKEELLKEIEKHKNSRTAKEILDALVDYLSPPKKK